MSPIAAIAACEWNADSFSPRCADRARRLQRRPHRDGAEVTEGLGSVAPGGTHPDTTERHDGNRGGSAVTGSRRDSTPRWAGETVVCLATGPSLTAEDVASCRGKARVIAI